MRWLGIGAALGLAAAIASLLSAPGNQHAFPAGAVAWVNGEAIRVEDYQRALGALERDRREPVGPSERERVLERLIDETLLVQRGLELGLARSDRRVRGDLVAAMIEVATAQSDLDEADDATARAFYAEQRERFARGARLWVESLRVRAAPLRSEAAALERAERAVRRLRAGEAFGAVDAELGDPQVAAAPRGLLPPAKLRDYLGPDLTRRAARLAVGETSDPLPASSGYRVLQLVDRVPGETPPFEEVEAEVRAEWRRRAGDDALARYLERLRASADLRVRPLENAR